MSLWSVSPKLGHRLKEATVLHVVIFCLSHFLEIIRDLMRLNDACYWSDIFALHEISLSRKRKLRQSRTMFEVFRGWNMGRSEEYHP